MLGKYDAATLSMMTVSIVSHIIRTMITECRIFIVMLSVVMPNVASCLILYEDCRYAECLYEHLSFCRVSFFANVMAP